MGPPEVEGGAATTTVVTTLLLLLFPVVCCPLDAAAAVTTVGTAETGVPGGAAITRVVVGPPTEDGGDASTVEVPAMIGVPVVTTVLSPRTV